MVLLNGRTTQTRSGGAPGNRGTHLRFRFRGRDRKHRSGSGVAKWQDNANAQRTKERLWLPPSSSSLNACMHAGPGFTDLPTSVGLASLASYTVRGRRQGLRHLAEARPRREFMRVGLSTFTCVLKACP